MGVLMGTALIVIIPEGVETLYSASDYSGELHNRRSFELKDHLQAKRGFVHAPDSTNSMWIKVKRAVKSDEKEKAKEKAGKDKAKAGDFDALPGPVIPKIEPEDAMVDSDDGSGTSATSPPKTPTEPGVVGILGGEDDVPAHTTPKTPPKVDTSPPPAESKTEREPHAWIGLSLILGFILMYLLDTLPLLSPTTPTRPHSNIYSLSDLSSSPVSTPAPPQRSLSTTLGLCIHAAADGIALGASSSSSSTTSLSLIIFVAIMVHKAPAAFGLTSVLLKQGLGKRSARAHLIVFSLAAPAGALATWILVRALGGGSESEPAVMKWWTGVLLLFSGGTFL